MRTETIKIMKFTELSEKAQEYAREHNRSYNVDLGSDWSSYTYELMDEVGDALGLTLEDKRFTGFYSQGDGASFTGFYKHLPGSLSKLKEIQPKELELHEIAQALDSIQKTFDYGLTVTMSRSSSRYCHENTILFSVQAADSDDELDYEKYPRVWNNLEGIFRALMVWFYRQLNLGYDSLISDEAVEHSLIANDQEFLESGENY